MSAALWACSAEPQLKQASGSSAPDVSAPSSEVTAPRPDVSAARSSRVQTLPYFDEPSFTPNWLTPGSEAERAFHSIGEFELINQAGERVGTNTLRGKIYVADFFFTTCPGICLKMTKNMRVLQDAFMTDPDVLLVSHTVTPDIDTPEMLQNYAKAHGILKDKWHLLTGERSQIYELGRKHYFVEEDLGVQKSENDFLHTENFLLVDKRGHIRGIYNGLKQTDIELLIADIRTLKAE